MAGSRRATEDGPGLARVQMKRGIRNLTRLDIVIPSLHGSGFDHLEYGMLEDQTLAFNSLGLDFIRSCVVDDDSIPPPPKSVSS